MPHVTYHVAQSLDGFIADRDGGIDWLPQPKPGADFGLADFFASVDALALGRTTYDQVRNWGAWPYDGKPTLVFSRRPPDADPPAGVTFVSGDPAEALAALPAEAHVWLVGGGDLATSFRLAGQIDYVCLAIVPVILGGGVPTWSESPPPTDLGLVGTRTHSGGLVELRYEVER